MFSRLLASVIEKGSKESEVPDLGAGRGVKGQQGVLRESLVPGTCIRESDLQLDLVTVK